MTATPPKPDADHLGAPNPPIMAILAHRLRMTEGQLYTAVLVVLLAVILTLTGLPSAHQTVPAIPISPTSAASPTTVTIP